MKDFMPAIDAYRPLFSLTETSTSHPRDSATHSPYLPYLPTDRSRKKERRQFRSETIAAHIESIRFHVPRQMERRIQRTNRGTTLRDRESLGGQSGGRRGGHKDKANRTKSRKRRSTRCERRGNDVKPRSRQHR